MRTTPSSQPTSRRGAAGELPAGWEDALPDLSAAPATATRNHSGRVLQGAAGAIPTLLGGSADLGGSNKTDIAGGGDLLADSPGGRIIHFGVREHAMGALMNGMSLHGGVHPFGGTFLIFSDYMRPAIRLAALMGLPVIYVFTHDSIGLGEDGPTHQPIEQLAALRAIPGLLDLRPADGPETAEAWRAALRHRTGPSFLALTRQTVPVVGRGPGRPAADGLHRGAYILRESSTGSLDAVLIASGSEVGIALAARGELATHGMGARVVSMPSWHLFSAQSRDYRAEVLPPGVLKVSVEAGTTPEWRRWVGAGGYLDRSGPLRRIGPLAGDVRPVRDYRGGCAVRGFRGVGTRRPVVIPAGPVSQRFPLSECREVGDGLPPGTASASACPPTPRGTLAGSRS